MGGILTPCCIQSKVQDKFQESSGAAIGGAGRDRGAWQGLGPALLPGGHCRVAGQGQHRAEQCTALISSSPRGSNHSPLTGISRELGILQQEVMLGGSAAVDF